MPFIAPAPRQGLGWRVTCAVTLVLSVICIVLSYRRTAWGGMALAALCDEDLWGETWATQNQSHSSRGEQPSNVARLPNTMSRVMWWL